MRPCWLVCGMLAAMLTATAAAAQTPEQTQITSVVLSKSSNGGQVTIMGNNFGPAPSGVPCANCSPANISVPGKNNVLCYACSISAPNQNSNPPVFSVPLWTNNKIVLTGLSAPAGFQGVVAITNPSTQLTAWGAGSVHGGTVHPTIASITFSGSGANLAMTIKGTGFGAAPNGVPGDTTINNFFFIDVTGSWEDGYAPDSNLGTIKYTSWTDTQITTAGFDGPYGQHNWYLTTGDAIAIGVKSTTDTGNDWTYWTGVYQPN